jgi:Cu-Zn family superoxide dismutase
VVLGGGGANDVVGKAVVVHADPDDYTSQPAGNAGSRIACGVISTG